MGDGLVKPVELAYGGRTKRIDDAVDSAVKAGAPTPAVEAAPEPVSKPTTAAEAQARMDAIKARQAAQDTTAKGLVKPTMGDRLKKLVGL
jgi:hypothetical protein